MRTPVAIDWSRVKEMRFDDDGWYGKEEVFKMLVSETRPKLIIEVGTWKGQSAFEMLRHAPKDCEIICVDTWLGAIELMKESEGVYETFLSNVKQKGLTHKVFPFRQTSSIAAKWFAQQKVKADLIYIDASHEEEDVRQDIQAYLPLVRKGGILFGDDYSKEWPGVQKALEGYDFELIGRKWVMRR